MKLNIVLDGYAEEEQTVEEVIFSNVINAITEKILLKIEKQLEEKIEAIINDNLGKEVNKKVEELLNDFFQKPLTISNGWNKETHYNSRIEYIKEKIEKTYNFSECNSENIMLNKVNSLVKSIIIKETDKAEKKFKDLGKKIAEETLEKSRIEQILNSLIENEIL